MPTIPARDSTMNHKRGPIVDRTPLRRNTVKINLPSNTYEMAQESTALINHVTNSFHRVKFILQATIIMSIKTQYFRSRDRRKTQFPDYAFTSYKHRKNNACQQMLIKGNEMGGTCGKNERYRTEYSRETKTKYDFEHAIINGRITLSWMRSKYCRRAQTGSVSLTSRWLWSIRQRSFGLRKIRENFLTS
jgi:hypothetical protein